MLESIQKRRKTSWSRDIFVNTRDGMYRWTDGQDGGRGEKKRQGIDRSHDVLCLRVESARMDDMNGREGKGRGGREGQSRIWFCLLTFGKDILLYELNGWNEMKWAIICWQVRWVSEMSEWVGDTVHTSKIAAKNSGVRQVKGSKRTSL